jgi:hypothetical protein
MTKEKGIKECKKERRKSDEPGEREEGSPRQRMMIWEGKGSNHVPDLISQSEY